MKKIGLMGGSFDPIHIGHLLLAQCAMEEMHLDEVWFIPTGYSYMKKDRKVTASDKRLQMTELAVRDRQKMRCLDIEVKREGYTYSYETLELLAAKYPEYTFYFIFGADCLFTIEDWKYPERIFSNAHIVAAFRNGASTGDMLEKANELTRKYNANITLLPFWNLEISSTEIRKRIKEGKSIDFLVPDEVISYIKQEGLYQNEN